MKRRNFVAAATTASGVALMSAPSIVHADPAIRWRLPSSVPRSLDTL